MGAIIPAILRSSIEEMRSDLFRLNGLVDTVQIDVVDQSFAKKPSWPYHKKQHEIQELIESGEALPSWGAYKFEADIMVRNVAEAITDWLSFGAQRIVMHLSQQTNMQQAIAMFKRVSGHDTGFAPDLVSFGIAVEGDTHIESIEEYVTEVDFVQFMGIARSGAQGQPFDSRVFEKIKIFRERHPQITIQVDGGVSLANAEQLFSSGADRLVVGSALWNSENLGETLRHFQEIAAGR